MYQKLYFVPILLLLQITVNGMNILDLHDCKQQQDENYSKTCFPAPKIEYPDDSCLHLASDNTEEPSYVSTNKSTAENTSKRLRHLVQTDVKPLTDQLEFTIYPSLTDGISEISLHCHQPQSAHLRLYDFRGKVIRKWDMDGTEFRETISLVNYPSGTYVLQLRTKKGVLTKKLFRN